MLAMSADLLNSSAGHKAMWWEGNEFRQAREGITDTRFEVLSLEYSSVAVAA